MSVTAQQHRPGRRENLVLGHIWARRLRISGKGLGQRRFGAPDTTLLMEPRLELTCRRRGSGGKRWVGARWRGRRREHGGWAGREALEAAGPSQEGGARSPAASLWGRGCRSSGGPPGPLLLGSGSDLPSGEALSLEPPPARGSVSRGHCPESRVRTSGPLTGPRSSAPWHPLGPGQAQLPDGPGRPCCTRMLAPLRSLGGSLTVLRILR